MFNLDQATILSELHACQTSDDSKTFYAKYLSKTGLITGAYKQMGSLAPEQKKDAGQFLSSLFQAVETAFHEKQRALKSQEWDTQLRQDVIDWSFPGQDEEEGHLTLQNQLRRRVEEIFANMGFHIHYGQDVVNQFQNFTSVNIPLTHPATEMHDTIYIDRSPLLKGGAEGGGIGEKLLLRTHTSCMQNELIKKYFTFDSNVKSNDFFKKSLYTQDKEQKSCKFIVPGKVYRYEDMDATHDCVFWQIEGVVIDKNISIGHFKAMIEEILKAMLETDQVEFRMRPAYFPFVEPGFEIDAKQVINGKTKWIESLGAGMIHPNVLEQAGVDSKEYSGFAFGMGMSRLVAVKNKIHDIRLFTNGDLRFVKSFGTVL